MIVFDLQCGRRHVFEAWFGSTTDFESQSARQLIACPICGDAAVGKAVMAPAVPAKSNRRLDPSAASHQAEQPDPKAIKAALQALAQMQAELEAGADYVGARLPDVARAIHLGEQPDRAIIGEASRADAEALADEGIILHPLPFRSRLRGDA